MATVQNYKLDSKYFAESVLHNLFITEIITVVIIIMTKMQKRYVMDTNLCGLHNPAQ
jgi:hypothetical protein